MSTFDKDFPEELAAYLEGDLDETAALKARLCRRLGESDSLRAEYEGLCAVIEDLEALGETYKRRIPEVDLVESVMAQVTRREEIRPAERRRGFKRSPLARRLVWAGLATAAVVLMVIGLARIFLGGGDLRTPLAPLATGPGPGQLPSPVQAPEGVEQPLHGLPAPGERVVARTDSGDQFEPVPAPDWSAVSPQQVVEAWKRSRTSAEFRETIRQWATLTPEEARAILQTAGLSPEAMVGAASFLTPDEREPYLLAAADYLEDEPAVQLALAQAYYEQSERHAAAEARLDAWGALDPDNALPAYLGAALLLEQGAGTGAVVQLEEAAALDRTDCYSRDFARYREQALTAGGMNPETSRLATAATAGAEQGDFLYELGADLLEYGRQYFEVGEFQVAEAIFKSVLRLGEQVYDTASFTAERKTGLELEMAAVELLGQVYTALGFAEGTEVLGSQSVAVRGGLDSIALFVEAVDKFLTTADLGLWSGFAQALLGRGDRALFDMFLAGDCDVVRFIQGGA